MIIKFKHVGDFSKTTKFFNKVGVDLNMSMLEKYGKAGVDALSKATPVDTGLTASSWYYKIKKTNDTYTIDFCNSNRNNGVLIAVILYYGHATRNGGYVEGRDYINPAIQPIFDQLAKDAWEEVKKS